MLNERVSPLLNNGAIFSAAPLELLRNPCYNISVDDRLSEAIENKRRIKRINFIFHALTLNICDTLYARTLIELGEPAIQSECNHAGIFGNGCRMGADENRTAE